MFRLWLQIYLLIPAVLLYPIVQVFRYLRIYEVLDSAVVFGIQMCAQLARKQLEKGAGCHILCSCHLFQLSHMSERNVVSLMAGQPIEGGSFRWQLQSEDNMMAPEGM